MSPSDEELYDELRGLLSLARHAGIRIRKIGTFGQDANLLQRIGESTDWLEEHLPALADLLATRQREREQSERVRELESDKRELTQDLSRWARRCGELEAERDEYKALYESTVDYSEAAKADLRDERAELVEALRPFVTASREELANLPTVRVVSVSPSDLDRARRLFQRAESGEGGA